MDRKDTIEPIENYPSLVSYYKKNYFNPVPINVENESVWRSLIRYRRNLYRHLMIPLSLFKNVVEFGCNSGEYALYLASIGARLTLVEPNEQVFPRMKRLFKKFGFEQNTTFVHSDIAGFKSQSQYDAVIAEGFLSEIANRDQMLLKICHLLRPGGIGIISFDDRYGYLLEMTKKLILWRAAQLKKIDIQDSLEIAKRLYMDDFLQLKVLRPFEAWWRDNLLNPFVSSKHFWTLEEVLALLEKGGCEFHSSSPKWVSIDHFLWYKNILPNRNQRLLNNWKENFSFFLTGFHSENEPASLEVIESVSNLMDEISEYTSHSLSSLSESPAVSYPRLLNEYFKKSTDDRLQSFNLEMEQLYKTIRFGQFDDLLSLYQGTKHLRNLWGITGPFICFTKLA